MRKASLLVNFLIFIIGNIHAQPIFSNIDINTGASNSTPWIVGTLNGKMVLSATYPGAGRELILSDGTTSGTSLLKDITPGTNSTGLFSMGTALVHNSIFFTANVTASGTELWVTDGSSAGTQMIKDINPGIGNGIASYSYITALNGKAYFAANDGVKGSELWVSDGTGAGTQLLKDINPGANSSSPAYFTELNGKLYFTADDGTNGKELWVTDGTSPGTQMVKDINAGAGHSSPAGVGLKKFAVFNNKIYFTANTPAAGVEIWSSDGTGTGTSILKDINPGSGDAVGILNFSCAVGNGKLFFPVTDNSNGQELWSTDGTEVGTQMVKDINPGSLGSFPKYLTSLGSKIVFTADDGVNGAEPFISDGTSAGTVLLKDIFPGSNTSKAAYYVSYKNYFYFTAQQINNDIQLWQSDGTASGTKIIGPPLAPNANPVSNLSASEFYLNPADTALYFSGNYDAGGEELWMMKDTSTIPASTVAYRNNTSSFILYPNPSNGNFKLKIDNINFKKGVVVIHDISGKTMYTSELKNAETSIAIPHLPGGIYTVAVQLDDSIMVQKITVR